MITESLRQDNSQSKQLQGQSIDCPTTLNNETETVKQPQECNSSDLQEIELLNKEIMTGAELAAFNGQDIPYLWEGLIPQYGISFLTGSSDCNKSTFLRQLALSIANGDDEFLGIRLNTRYQKVIMVVTEDLAVNVAALLNKQRQVFPDYSILNNIRFIFPQSFNIESTLTEMLKKEKVDCIIVDTWTDTFSGDLNASNAVRKSLHPYNYLVREFGCTVLALHHEKKGSEDKSPSKDNMLGSMGIQAYARVVLQMKRDTSNSNRRLLTPVKGNYIQDSFKEQSFILELDENTMFLTNVSNSSLFMGKKNSRIFTSEEKMAFKKLISGYLAEDISQDEMVERLSKDLPEARTPSKGSINKLIKEIHSEQ